MKRLALNTFGFATAVVALSGLAMAQEPAQGVKLMAGNAVLVHSLSSKSATTGEAITVKLTSAIKTPGGVELPRGTELIGRVDQVKASDKNGPSTLVLTFNQARLKDGKAIAVKATLAGFSAAGGIQELPTAVPADGSFDQEAGSTSGVALHSAVQDKTSGTLTDGRRDINFGAGTQFLVAVGVPSAQTTSAAE
jgi:hypothetical protein